MQVRRSRRSRRSQTMAEVIILVAVVGIGTAAILMTLPTAIEILYVGARNHITAPF